MASGEHAEFTLLEKDATQLEVDHDVDGVLARAWERLRPSARVIIMDMGLTQGGPYRLPAPIARLLVKYAPGDAYSDPWNDLANYGPVHTKHLLLGFFYVSAVAKPEQL